MRYASVTRPRETASPGGPPDRRRARAARLPGRRERGAAARRTAGRPSFVRSRSQTRSWASAPASGNRHRHAGDRDRRRAVRKARAVSCACRVRRLARRDRSGTGRSGARAGARHGAGADARRRARRERSLSLRLRPCRRRGTACRGSVALESCARVRLAWRYRRRAGALAPARAVVAHRPWPSGPGLSLGARALCPSRGRKPRPGPAGHRHHHALDREHVDLRATPRSSDIKKTRAMAAGPSAAAFRP